jgi:hypothetical protein
MADDIFFRDAAPLLDPEREARRRELVESVRRLRLQSYSGGSDPEVREQLREAEDELRALDRGRP